MPPPNKASTAQGSAISLRQLRAFVAVAHTSSMTRAAQKLHLSNSALSMLISGLEADLGLRLFERTTRSLTLSEAGRELLPAVEQVFGNLDSAFENLRQFHHRRSSRFVLATSPLLAATLMPTLLARFRGQHPDVRIELWDLPVGEIAQTVRSGQADVGICTADVDTPDLLSRTLFQDRLVLCCLAQHPLARRRAVRWEELAGEPLAVLRPGSGLRTLVDQGFAQSGTPQNKAYEVTQVSTAVGLVEAGLAVSVLPSYALASTRSQGVKGIALTAPELERNIVALTLPQRQLPAACDAFLALFCEHLLQAADEPYTPPLQRR